MDDLAAAIKAANANTPVGTLDGARQTLTIQANRQLMRAAEFAQLIIATQPGGSTTRLGDVAEVEDSVESVKTASWANGERSITLEVRRQPDANTVSTVDAIRAAMPGLVAQVPDSVSALIRNDRSISLVAVFIPIFFMPGVIGGLFHEFAIVVSLAILVSAGFSLTLVPMLASRYIKPAHHDDPVLRLTAWFEHIYEWSLKRYEHGLDWCLMNRVWVLLTALATVVVTIALVVFMPKGFFPTEDIGQISVNMEAVEDISFPAMTDLLQRVSRALRENPSVDTVVMGADDTNNGRMFISLKPRGERPPMDKGLQELRLDIHRISVLD